MKSHHRGTEITEKAKVPGNVLVIFTPPAGNPIIGLLPVERTAEDAEAG
jgi:hypothetical protein